MTVGIHTGDWEAAMECLEEHEANYAAIFETITVDEKEYTKRVKKAPTGNDNWMFQFKDGRGQPDVFEHNGEYTKALASAKKAAAKAGATSIKLI